MDTAIGDRVRACLSRLSDPRTDRDMAESVGMTPDAFSRAVNGKRQFSSIELARISDELGVSIHWLITGEQDPHRLIIAARHNFDFSAMNHELPGHEQDAQILEAIGLVYRQAFDESIKLAPLPASATEMTEALGGEFVRPFVDRIEERLGVDVVRIPELSTAYSFSILGRRVIAMKATGNWFWENWSLAHELAHLALDHHAEDVARSHATSHEVAANAFAAELLLPEAEMRSIDWVGLTAAALADWLWGRGISTDALSRRLNSLRVPCGDVVSEWSGQPTQRLLRRHWSKTFSVADPITERMDAAAARRFPRQLQVQHLDRIASGNITKRSLAWMLDIQEDALEVDAPAVYSGEEIDDLAIELGL